MKYAIVLATALIIGCGLQKEKIVNTQEYATVDSIIGKSEQNLSIVGGANKKSDSLVTRKIDKTVKTIKKLETEVKQLKKENNELKNQLDANDGNGEPYIIRTISDYQDY